MPQHRPLSSQQLAERREELSREREALETMLRSEGWALFCRRVNEEWQGQGYFSRMGVALAGEDVIAPKVIHRTSLEVMRMLEWPASRVTHLKGQVE